MRFFLLLVIISLADAICQYPEGESCQNSYVINEKLDMILAWIRSNGTIVPADPSSAAHLGPSLLLVVAGFINGWLQLQI